MEASTSDNVTFPDAKELSNKELCERYDILKKKFENLTVEYNTLKQVLRDTERSYHISLNTQKNLADELEVYQSGEIANELNNRMTALQEFHATETLELKDEIRCLKEALCDASTTKLSFEEAKAENMSWRERTEKQVNEIAEMRVAMDIQQEELKATEEREATALAELAEARAMLHQRTTAGNYSEIIMLTIINFYTD